MIRAGLPTEVNKYSGMWIFIDIGFSASRKSCGLMIHDGEPKEVFFSQLIEDILKEINDGDVPLNILIEAPLSVAFNQRGNPTGRAIEKKGSKNRYWYVGLGCSVLVAATYLLRAIHDAQSKREIRLFEGLVSFKQKGQKTSHSEDVVNLRQVVWNGTHGRIMSPEKLAASPEHKLRSGFHVAGMNFGIPPVVEYLGK